VCRCVYVCVCMCACVCACCECVLSVCEHMCTYTHIYVTYIRVIGNTSFSDVCMPFLLLPIKPVLLTLSPSSSPFLLLSFPLLRLSSSPSPFKSVSLTVQNAFWIHPCSWLTAFSKSTTRIKRRRRRIHDMSVPASVANRIQQTHNKN
jgi:hypothetical protein